MDLNLKNKTALVTGGSRGIGRAICESFAREGANVAFSYLNSREKAEELSFILQEKYRIKAVAISADMSIESDILSMISTVEESFGLIDILVNNGGLSFGSDNFLHNRSLGKDFCN